MKRIKYILSAVVLFVGSASLNAQSYYDANRLIGSDLDGTARFVGMGGAMSALGGDLSVMGVNPAGIGIYRSNDANVSFGVMNNSTKSDYQGTMMSKDNNAVSFNNIGFVLAVKQGDYTPLRFVNFGFNVRKVKSFDRNMSAAGTYNFSQTEQFAGLVNRNSAEHQDFLSGDMLSGSGVYEEESIPWLAPMAYRANLLVLNNTQDGYYSYFDPNNRGHEVGGNYESRERGGVYSYDFNLSLNLHDRVYLGATIGAYDVDYRRTSTYSETFWFNNEDDGYYSIQNDFQVEGTGIDLKLGAIVRPIESSPLRIGLAISTPVFYHLTEYNMASLYYDTYDSNDKRWEETIYPHTSYDGTELEGRTEYDVKTPWKYNVSLGYTVGSRLAIGAEYEYMNYASTDISSNNGDKLYKEYEMGDSNMKGVNTFRVGAEYRFVPEFNFRLGYNYTGASIADNSYRELLLNDIRTDTEYSRGKAIRNYTMGFGYRGKTFYADMAYKYQTQEEDFFAFDPYAEIGEGLPATKITNDRHQVMLTLGMRF